MLAVFAKKKKKKKIESDFKFSLNSHGLKGKNLPNGFPTLKKMFANNFICFHSELNSLCSENLSYLKLFDIFFIELDGDDPV